MVTQLAHWLDSEPTGNLKTNRLEFKQMISVYHNGRLVPSSCERAQYANNTTRKNLLSIPWSCEEKLCEGPTT
jgi:hypothetical protein